MALAITQKDNYSARCLVTSIISNEVFHTDHSITTSDCSIKVS